MTTNHASDFKAKSPRKTKVPFISGLQRSKMPIRAITGIVLLLIGAFMTEAVYEKLCRSSFFQVTDIKITGNHIASREQITALSKVDIHSNLLAINLNQVKSLLESHPWIAGAKVVRDWPNRLLITVKEKKPVALLNRETGLFYLDSNGRTIAAASPNQELDFPVVTGLEEYSFNQTSPELTPEILEDAMGLLKLAAGNSTILPKQNISEIHISKDGAMILYLLERAFPIYMGDNGKISTRYYRLVKVLRNLYKTGEFLKVAYIRLDYQQDTILVGKTQTSSRNQG